MDTPSPSPSASDAISSPQPPVPASAERVPWGRKIAYGVGGMTNVFMSVGVNSMAVPVYQMTLKMDPALLGLLIAIPRLWDAVTDPVMGYISDRTDSRFGRRRPYIVLGAILSALAFILIWQVPASWPMTGQATWFLTTSLLFYTCSTIWAVPFTSLGYEITPNYHERTNVMAVSTFFGRCGELAYQWIFPLATLAVFGSLMHGVQFVTISIALVVFLGLGVMPGLFVQERFRHQPLATDSPAVTGKLKFWSGFGDFLKNRSVVVLVLVTLLTMVAGTFASSLDYYLLVYHMHHGDVATGAVWKGILTSGYAVMGFIAIIPMAWCCRRFDKRTTLIGVYALLFLDGFVKWFVFQPGNTWIVLLDPLFSGPLWIALGMIVPSMTADICDDDEWKHGKRREGMLGAFLSWINKAGGSLAFLVSGVALKLVGFDAALGGSQEPGSIFRMRLIFAGSTIIIALLVIVVLCFYPLNEQKLQTIRADLEKRRGKV